MYVYNIHNGRHGCTLKSLAGREVTMISIDIAKVKEIVERHDGKKSALIAILQDVQKEFRYLPQEALEFVSKAVDIGAAKVYSVATFYENFSLEPKGKYVIKICDGTACHVRKSIPILEKLRKELGLGANKHTTDDLIFTVETVSCLGACGLAPVITVNERVYAKMTPDSAASLLKEIREAEKNANQ